MPAWRLALVAAGSCVASQALALERLTDEQLSGVNAQGTFNFVLENIEYRGVAVPGVAEAGSITVIAADGSSLSRKGYQFSADNIGTLDRPLTVGTSQSNASVNSIDAAGQVEPNGTALGERGYLRIGYPELGAWNNVDVSFNAVFGNPTETSPNNPNIAAGGAPSANLALGRVTLDNFALAGSIEMGGIPEGYRIESVKVDDGSQGAPSRQGLLLNIDIQTLVFDQLLLETQQADGVYDESRDLAIDNFSLKNLQMRSATVETAPTGWRFAYHDPQPFTSAALPPGEAGHRDMSSAAYDAAAPRMSLSFETQMPHGQRSVSAMQGVTLDHLVFNLRTD